MCWWYHYTKKCTAAIPCVRKEGNRTGKTNQYLAVACSEITTAASLCSMSFLISTSQVALHASSVSWCCERFTRTHPQVSDSQLSLFLLAIFHSDKSASVLQTHLAPCLTVCFLGLQAATQLSSSVTLGFYVHLPLTAWKGGKAHLTEQDPGIGTSWDGKKW